MKPRTNSWDDDVPFLPSLSVYEPQGGLKTDIGFFPLKEESPAKDPNQLELLSPLLEAFKAWTRPVVHTVAGLGTVAGLFFANATPEKMAVTAALAGCYVIARMKEKLAGKA